MLANECLSHPWLDKEVIPAPCKENVDDHVINTKNLRKFVIRRRWQVRYFTTFAIELFKFLPLYLLTLLFLYFVFRKQWTLFLHWNVWEWPYSRGLSGIRHAPEKARFVWTIHESFELNSRSYNVFIVMAIFTTLNSFSLTSIIKRD